MNTWVLTTDWKQSKDIRVFSHNYLGLSLQKCQPFCKTRKNKSKYILKVLNLCSPCNFNLSSNLQKPHVLLINRRSYDRNHGLFYKIMFLFMTACQVIRDRLYIRQSSSSRTIRVLLIFKTEVTSSVTAKMIPPNQTICKRHICSFANYKQVLFLNLFWVMMT